VLLGLIGHPGIFAEAERSAVQLRTLLESNRGQGKEEGLAKRYQVNNQ
jgi:hypothetical protein